METMAFAMNTDLNHQMYQSILMDSHRSVPAENMDFGKTEIKSKLPGISVVETMTNHNYFSGLDAPLKSTRSDASEFATTYDLLRSRSRASSPTTQSRANGHSQYDGSYPIDENKLKKYFKEIASVLGANSTNSEARADAMPPATISHFRQGDAPITAFKPDPFRTIASFAREPSHDPHPTTDLAMRETASMEARRWLEQELESARALAMQQVPPTNPLHLPPPPPSSPPPPCADTAPLPASPAAVVRGRRRRASTCGASSSWSGPRPRSARRTFRCPPPHT